jgi:hypothetical protein
MKTIFFTLISLTVLSSFAFAAPHGGGHSGGSGHANKSPGGSKPSPSSHNKAISNAKKPVNNAKNNPSNANKGPNKNYFSANAKKFANGYYYGGRNHHHWGSSRFDARYGCELYWDDGLSGWFYYCCRDDRYYPVDYCPYGTYTCDDTTDAAANDTQESPMPAPIPDPIPAPRR